MAENTEPTTGPEEHEPTESTEAAEDTDTGPGVEQSSTEDDQSADTGDESDGKDWKAEADKWKALARKHEENVKAAEKDRTERDELREQVANYDAETIEAQSALAAERLHTKLARAGMSEQDATALLEHIDPMRLIEDGKPSVESINALAESLSRSLGRGVDDDQGQTSDTPSFSADQWLRKKARR